MPPGPTPIPFIGNFFASFGGNKGSHENSLELRKKYGDPMTIYVGNVPWVILTKYELAKFVLNQTTFSDRQASCVIELMLNGVPNIVFAKYGAEWQFHRKVSSKCMREIIDAATLETKIIEAVDLTVEDMMKHKDKIDPKLHIRHVVYNVLAQFAYEKTYKIDDQEFFELQRLSDVANEDFTSVLAIDAFLPFSSFLIPRLRSWPLRCIPLIKRLMDTAGQMNAVRMKQIHEHRRTFVAGRTRDVCDALLREQEILRKQGSEEAHWLSDNHISSILLDFFLAGTDTTSLTLLWWCLFMVMHPDIQEECYQAIQAVVGDRLPQLRDRNKIPIIDATILETMRCCPVAPMGLPHAAVSDTKIGGYHIPEGSTVLANLHAMHIDPEHWEDPLKFNPRLHFLDENGEIRKRTSFAPFGFGRRICIGEQLAKNNMFLIIVRLLQRVRLEALENFSYTLDYNKEMEGTLTPLPYFVKVTARK